MKGTLTCPKCGHKQEEVIPERGCQQAYICSGCKETIAAKQSCCVFCDYGDKKCPVAEAGGHPVD